MLADQRSRVGSNLQGAHTRSSLDDDVDLVALAEGTVGLTGADIRNIANEAALGRLDRIAIG